MKRLRDDRDATDPVVARGARLLAAAEPYRPAAGMQRRVLASLDRSKAMPRWPLPSLGRLVSRWRTALAGLTIAATAAATAAVGVVGGIDSREDAPEHTLRAAPPARQVTDGTKAPPVGIHAPLDVPPSDTTAPSESVTTGSAPGPKSGQGSPVAPNGVPSSAHLRGRASAPTRNSDVDSELVYGAIEALRGGRDPARAGRLLEQYRRQAPSGVLAEEALALAIEAAMAEEDPKARVLARRYLNQYPDGRYRQSAQQALARSGSTP